MDKLKAPFPWFGGKSRASHLVWERFGDVPNYVEPFAGSLAVLLGRPTTPRVETVNDVDCYLANFWRALGADPGGVATHCDLPVNEADLSARRKWMRENTEFIEKMKTDPLFYDLRVAGWWVWGVSCWIGSNWCNPVEQLPHLGPGKGVHRSSLPHLGDSGKGVHRSSLPGTGVQTHLGPGKGVHRSSLPHLGPGKGVHRYLVTLSERLRRVRVCCGDWRRVLTPSVTTKYGITGVFLDPPYDGYEDVYSDDGFDATAVTEWALEAGADPKMRIALCGYDLDVPSDWSLVQWKANRGYSKEGNDNRLSETIAFSPHCLGAQGRLFEKAS